MCVSCGCKALARSRVYQFLALGFGQPDAALPSLLREQLAPLQASLGALEEEGSREALRALAPALDALTVAELEGSYLQCFGHIISQECPPYEAEYDQAHIFQKSQTLADVAGFYRAFGLELAPNLNERLDHIGVELEFMHFLCLKEAYGLGKGHPEEQVALGREAQAKFLGEHLGQWALGFGGRLEEKAGGSLYGLFGQLLAAFLTFETRAMGLEPPPIVRPVPVELPDEETEGCEECPLVVPLLMRSREP